MRKLKMIVDMLSDGKWHSVAELIDKLDLAFFEVWSRLEFLNEFELAKFDVERERIRIDRDFKRLPELPSQ